MTKFETLTDDTNYADALDSAISFLKDLGYEITFRNGRYFLRNKFGKVVNPNGLSGLSVIVQANFENRSEI